MRLKEHAKMTLKIINKTKVQTPSTRDDRPQLYSSLFSGSKIQQVAPVIRADDGPFCNLGPQRDCDAILGSLWFKTSSF